MGGPLSGGPVDAVADISRERRHDRAMLFLARAGLLAVALSATGCITEFRPVSPAALPDLTATIARHGKARAIDLHSGERFEVEGSFDAEIVTLDRSPPRRLIGPITAGF